LYAGLEEASAYQFAAAMTEGCLSTGDRIRPFSQTPQGYILGEGVGMFLVENEKYADKKGRKAIATIEGYASGFDPNSGNYGTNPDGDVMEYVVREALRKAKISAEDIAFVSASANSTHCDLAHARVITRVFGEEMPVACYKQKFGEAWGASGALSVAAAIADLQKKKVSPIFTDGYSKVEGINLVRKQELAIEKDYAVVLSCSPDGNCAAMVIKKAQ
jgi:3-oxoacyl-(acyl-carrier-protein) synthase